MQPVRFLTAITVGSLHGLRLCLEISGAKDKSKELCVSWMHQAELRLHFVSCCSTGSALH